MSTTLTKKENTRSEADLERARACVEQLNDILPGARQDSFTVIIDGREIELPSSFARVMAEALKIIANGHQVEVSPVNVEIGTQDAADLLGASRPFLVKLLDTGKIPSRKVGVQRRVIAADVLAYREREKEQRRRVLQELAETDQELGLDE
ncbi:MAG: helix-turn-helix domain-containing protein [Verrucomicrobiales bacterium]|nr:helix-turn-helix domain-containing protein [Verrucomicrobiales bacterium]